MYAIDDSRCGTLVSEVVPCADFMFNVSIETGAKLFNSPGWDVLFAVMYDYLVEVFHGCVYVVVVVEVSQCVVYVLCKVVPICPFVICVSAFGWFFKWPVEKMCYDDW